jgi:hypothetical protein
MKRLSIVQLTPLLITAALLLTHGTVRAQEPMWRFGAFGGMNFNIVGTGAQTLEGIGTDFAQPHVNGNNDIIDGTGLG